MPQPEDLFPLRPPLPLPDGWSEDSLRQFLAGIRPADAPPAEIAVYCGEDWRRFVYTWGLARDLRGNCLELGANPYFTTILLQEFTELQLTLANYFGPQFPAVAQQTVLCQTLAGEQQSKELSFHHFNIESQAFPFGDATFDCVLFCEIIEHLQMDPAAVIREIKRVLKPDAILVLTTPNVARLENVARLLSGANVYDPYSGYGPYGRHNREYNRDDLFLLLDYCGFELEVMFTADVHDNRAESYVDIRPLVDLLEFRQHDLGQYIFVRGRNARPSKTKRPLFLYRSYDPSELE
jgi:SAM-dependent methyltransferase